MKKPLLLSLSMLCASVALAEPPVNTTQKEASSLVRHKLVDPLTRAQGKRSKFSRAAPPPNARRVRVLDSTPLADARGKHFVRFAVDERFAWDHEGEWTENALRGCVYLDDAQVWVKRGDAHVPASSLLGSKPKPRRDVCQVLPTDDGTLARL